MKKRANKFKLTAIIITAALFIALAAFIVLLRTGVIDYWKYGDDIYAQTKYFNSVSRSLEEEYSCTVKNGSENVIIENDDFSIIITRAYFDVVEGDIENAPFCIKIIIVSNIMNFNRAEIYDIDETVNNASIWINKNDNIKYFKRLGGGGSPFGKRAHTFYLKNDGYAADEQFEIFFSNLKCTTYTRK